MELTSFVECILFNTVFCLLVVPCLSAAWEDVKFDLILCIENIYTPQPKTQSQWQWSTLRQLSMAVYFLLGPKQIVGSEGFPKAEFVFIQLRHFQRFLSGDKSARAYRNGNSSYHIILSCTQNQYWSDTSCDSGIRYQWRKSIIQNNPLSQITA